MQMAMVGASTGIWWMNPESSYLKALVVTCLAVAIVPLIIGSPGKTLRDNDREIRQNGTKVEQFIHNNLILLFVGLTIFISFIF
ncbi:MAG: hypothetical protein HLX50_01210 [Alteromonadaceae bacterium]|nr:hypothetical protein [Alteromonadaceae bacterium]